MKDRLGELLGAQAANGCDNDVPARRIASERGELFIGGQDDPIAKESGKSCWYDNDSGIGSGSETSSLVDGATPSETSDNMSQGAHVTRRATLTLTYVAVLLKEGRKRRKREGAKSGDIRHLFDLNNKVRVILHGVTEIQENTRKLTALHTESLMSPNTPDDVLQEKAKNLEDRTRCASMSISKSLKELERYPLPEQSAVRRVHATQLAYARKAYVGAMERHEREMERYAKGLRALLAKQMAIAGNGLCQPKDIDSYLEGNRMQIFVDNYGTREREARAALQELSERNSELSKIEQSITEIRNLFFHMANLVEDQGDKVDSIEAHVLAAVGEVTEGSDQLQKARKKKTSARKKKLWLTGVGAGVATGLIATAAILL